MSWSVGVAYLLACSGCDVLFQLDPVPDPDGGESNGGGDGGNHADADTDGSRNPPDFCAAQLGATFCADFDRPETGLAAFSLNQQVMAMVTTTTADNVSPPSAMQVTAQVSAQASDGRAGVQISNNGFDGTIDLDVKLAANCQPTIVTVDFGGPKVIVAATSSQYTLMINATGCNLTNAATGTTLGWHHLQLSVKQLTGDTALAFDPPSGGSVTASCAMLMTGSLTPVLSVGATVSGSHMPCDVRFDNIVVRH